MLRWLLEVENNVLLFGVYWVKGEGPKRGITVFSCGRGRGPQRIVGRLTSVSLHGRKSRKSVTHVGIPKVLAASGGCTCTALNAGCGWQSGVIMPLDPTGVYGIRLLAAAVLLNAVPRSSVSSLIQRAAE
jgi:hypothetical protein